MASHIIRRITFLAMASFHGIPSSNLVDGQSSSLERLHDMFCPAPWGSPKFGTAGLMCLSVDCILCTVGWFNVVDCAFCTTMVVPSRKV